MSDESAAPPPPPDLPAPPDPEVEPAVEADPRGRVFPCFECGADVEFSIDSQELKCPYCGAAQAIEHAPDEAVEERDLEAALERDGQRRQKAHADDEALQEVQCESCAGTVQFTGTLTSLECPYCATPVQLAGAHQSEDSLPVDGVLPFQVDEARAAGALRAWVKSRWFLPSDLKQRGVSAKFQGVYLPFWTFDALTANQYRGQRGDHYWVSEGSGKNQRRVRRTRWSSASGEFRRFFDDVLVVAGRGLPLALLRKLEPWPTAQVRPFRNELLAGALARRYDVPLREGFGEGKQIMVQRIEAEVRQRIGGDEQRVQDIRSQFAGLSYKHLLLPVWLLSYRYGEKTYQVTINAASARVEGERPYSVIKITLAALAAIAVVGGLAWVFRN